MISKDFDLTKYRIEIKRHAFKRANQNNIDLDLIYYTIKTGKIVRFGKNNLRFVKKFKKFTIICVDEIIGDTIKIATICISRK